MGVQGTPILPLETAVVMLQVLEFDAESGGQVPVGPASEVELDVGNGGLMVEFAVAPPRESVANRSTSEVKLAGVVAVKTTVADEPGRLAVDMDPEVNHVSEKESVKAGGGVGVATGAEEPQEVGHAANDRVRKLENFTCGYRLPVTEPLKDG